MKELRNIALCAILLSAVLGLGAPAWAEAPGASGPQGDTWASIAKLPDWQGIWELDWRHGGGLAAARPAPPKLTPTAQAKLDAYRKAQQSGKDLAPEQANCLPPGMPGIMTQPYPIEFLYSPGKVAIAVEAYMQLRQVFTDGRGHPKDPDPLFNGHSIGHWEGDVLVVNTTGFLPGFLNTPVRNSDKLSVTEKFTLDTAKLALTRTYSAEDPVYLKGKYTGSDTVFVADAPFNPGKCQELNFIDYSKQQKP